MVHSADRAPVTPTSPTSPVSLHEPIELVTFDCFGTLIDWEKALPALGVPTERMSVFLHESERIQRPARRSGAFVGYRKLLEEVGAGLRPDLPAPVIAKWARELGELPFFAEVPAAIALLGQVVDVGVVSNCDAVHQLDVARRLGKAWDVACVAEEIEAYKPTDRAWDRALAFVERRGYQRAAWLHVSAWDDYDLAPAAARGIRTAYVPRPGGLEPREGSVDATFTDVLELARAVANAKGGPLLYEVTAGARSAEVMSRWIRWLEDEHLAEVRGAQGVKSAELIRLDELHVRCLYRFRSRASLQRYIERDAPRLRARASTLFSPDEIELSRRESVVLHAL